MRKRLATAHALYKLPLIDVNRRMTCVEFPRGTPLAVGDIFRILQPFRINPRSLLLIPGLRKVVALVQVLAVEEGTRAIVIVLKGSVIRGHWAESVDKERVYRYAPRSLNVPDFFSILHPKPHSVP